MLKKVSLLIMSMLICCSMNINVYAKEHVDPYEESLKHISDRSNTVKEVYNFKNSDKVTLDTNFEKTLAQEAKIDKKVSNIVFKLSKNKNLKEKAVEVNKDGRIEVMKYIIDILEKNDSNLISESELELLQYYLTKYGPYTDDVYIINYVNALNDNLYGNSGISTYAPYNRTVAANYALEYALSYNTPYYPDLTHIGGDCANFVSQALKAGGKPTDSKWFITRLNTKYLKPQTIAQLDASWKLADPSPWISAKQFEKYWSSKATKTEELSSSYVYNNKSKVYNKAYYRGDAVQILQKVYWWYEGYHTMIITDYKSSDFLLSYHTANRKNVSLNSIASKYNSTKYKFKFFGM